MKKIIKIESIIHYYKDYWSIQFEGKDGVYASYSHQNEHPYLFVILDDKEYVLNGTESEIIEERRFYFCINGKDYFLDRNSDAYDSFQESKKIALTLHGLNFGCQILKYNGTLKVRDYSTNKRKENDNKQVRVHQIRNRVPRRYRVANEFSDAEIEVKNKYYIQKIYEEDETEDRKIFEKIVINPSDSYPFMCIYAKSYIDENGKLTQKEPEYIFLNDKLKEDVNCSLEEEPEFYRDDRILAKCDGKYGFLSLDHCFCDFYVRHDMVAESKDLLEMPIPFIYDDIRPFGENEFLVTINGCKGVMDINGIELTRIKYSDISESFEEKPIIVQNALSGRFGVLDKKGNEFIPTIYSFIDEIDLYDDNEETHEYFYIVVQGDLYGEYNCGVINQEGEIIIPFCRQVLFYKNNYFFTGDFEYNLGLRYDEELMYDSSFKLDDEYASCQFRENHYGVESLTMTDVKGNVVLSGISDLVYSDDIEGISLKEIILTKPSKNLEHNIKFCLLVDYNINPYLSKIEEHLTTKPYKFNPEIITLLFRKHLLFHNNIHFYGNYIIDTFVENEYKSQRRVFYVINRKIQNDWKGTAVRVMNIVNPEDDYKYPFNNTVIFIKFRNKVGMIHKGELVIPCKYDSICLYNGDIYLAKKKRNKTARGKTIRNFSEILNTDYIYRASKENNWSIESFDSSLLKDAELLWFSSDHIIYDDDDYFYDCYDNRDEQYQWTDEDAWDAMTDGQYGDYPGSGWNPEMFGY